MKRIAFIGAGAVGGYVGAHLHRGGYDVTLVDQWPEHVEAIKRDGLRFSGTLGEYAVRVPALHIHEAQCLAARPVDIVIVCTKLYDTAWATTLMSQYLAAGGYVVTLQNGLVEEVVASIVGWGRTVGCIASTLSAEAHEPGRIMRTRQPGGGSYTVFRVGEIHGRVTGRVAELVEMLSCVDSAKATTNLWGERWSKLVANCMTTAVAGVTGLNLRAVLTGELTRRAMIRLAAEGILVGRAMGFAMEPIRRVEADTWLRAENGDASAVVEIDRAIEVELQRLTPEGQSGTAQDLRKGRRTEVDFMNGYVAEKGRQVGLPARAHEAIAEVVRRIERGVLRPGLQHLDSLLATA